MKRCVLAAALAALSVVADAANMASQPWVMMKLDELREEMGVTKAVSPMAVDAGTNGTVYAFFEAASVQALSVTNSATVAVTNGTLFAWIGNGVYTNAIIQSAVFATKTNFVWNGIQSAVVNGIDTFPGAFSVKGLYVTPTDAKAITGGAQ